MVTRIQLAEHNLAYRLRLDLDPQRGRPGRALPTERLTSSTVTPSWSWRASRIASHGARPHPGGRCGHAGRSPGRSLWAQQPEGATETATPITAPTSTSVGASTPRPTRASANAVTRPAATHLPTCRQRPTGISVYSTPTKVAAKIATGRDGIAQPAQLPRRSTPNGRGRSTVAQPDRQQDRQERPHEHDQMAETPQHQQRHQDPPAHNADHGSRTSGGHNRLHADRSGPASAAQPASPPPRHPTP